MTFAEYFVLLQRRWRVWLAGVLLGLLVATTVSVLAPTRYTATAMSFVTVAERIEDTGSSDAIFQGSQFAVQRVKSYAPLVKSREVLEPVIRSMGLAITVRELGRHVTVSSAPETVLLDVAVTDSDPELAARLADAISVRLGQVIEELETPRGSDVSNVTVSLARHAPVPVAPSSPRVLLNLLLGGMAGLALGLVAAVLRHYLDKRIKTSDDVRAITDMSPLGTTLYQRTAGRRPLVALDWRSASAERYRTVRTALKFATVDRDLRHFVVTSQVAGEGKTSVACNLAISWAQSGASVCLVEADLRRPGVSRFLGIDGSIGLSDVLVAERDLDQVLVPWNHDLLTVLPAGSLPPDPAALLGSAAMSTLVDTLRDRFDVVVYDSPPMLSVTDAVVLGQQVDGVVLVIKSSSTRRDQVASCVETLRRSRLALLGSIVTNERRRAGGPEHEYTSDLSHDRAELAPLRGEASGRAGRPDGDAAAPAQPGAEAGTSANGTPAVTGSRAVEGHQAVNMSPVVEGSTAVNGSASPSHGSSFWLGHGEGRLLLPCAGSGTGLRIDDVSGSATDVRVRFGTDKEATGGGMRLSVRPRVLENSDRYFADVSLDSDHGVSLVLGRHVDGMDVRLCEATVDLTVETGDLIQVRVRATGTSPTTLQAKVWRSGEEEPDHWAASASDDAVELQVPGGVSLGAQLSDTATNAPVIAVLDDLWVRTRR